MSNKRTYQLILKFADKLVQTLPILIWFLIFLFHVLFSLAGFFNPEYSLADKFGYAFIGGSVIFLGEGIVFLLTFPHWIFLVICLYFLRKRNFQSAYLYTTLWSNILMIAFGFILDHFCSMYSWCYSEGSLASGGGVIILLIVCQIMWTLPFMYWVNKTFLGKLAFSNGHQLLHCPDKLGYSRVRKVRTNDIVMHDMF